MMSDPITAPATAAAAVSTGFLALLIGWFGEIGADVMMVVLAALAGCYIALSSIHEKSVTRIALRLTMSLVLALIFSWALTSALSAVIPFLHTPYTSSMVALLIGYATGSDRISKIVGGALSKVEEKTGIKEE
jgi:hypothetical protein